MVKLSILVFSSRSWPLIYCAITSSVTFPLLATKYPRAHKCCPQNCLFNSLYSICSLRDVFPFWEHVQDGTPPPLDGSAASAKFLAERFANSKPSSHIDLSSNAADLLRQYDEACEQLEAITEQKQLAENLLKEMMGENEIGTAGDRVITWKSTSRESLDSKTLKAEHPALYKKYANKTTYRRFSIKAAA